MWRFLRGLVGHGSPTVIVELHEPLRRHEITQIRPRSARRTCRRAPSSAARRTTTTASADAVERAPHPCATWTDRRDGLRTRGDRPTRPAPPAVSRSRGPFPRQCSSSRARRFLRPKSPRGSVGCMRRGRDRRGASVGLLARARAHAKANMRFFRRDFGCAPTPSRRARLATMQSTLTVDNAPAKSLAYSNRVYLHPSDFAAFKSASPAQGVADDCCLLLLSGAG